MKEFVNLHAHTSLGSMLDALNDVNELFDKVAEYGQRALAITDHGTLAAHFDAFHAYKRTGVKFIPGCEAYFVNSYDPIMDETGKAKKEKRKHLLILAQNDIGYKNLLKLNFIGFQNHDIVMGSRVFPKINWNVLEEHSEGLIVTSACGQSPVARYLMDDNFEDALRTAERFASVFPGRFFIELHPHALKVETLDQHKINTGLIKIAKRLNLPLTTAADTHYLTRNMEKYHDVLLAINSKKPVDDPTRHRYGIDEFYVKQGQEIFEYLAKHYGEEVAEEAVSNTVKVAEMCDNPDYMDVEGNHLPVFPVKDELDYSDFKEWVDKKGLRNLAEDTAYMRYRCFKSFSEIFSSLSEDEKALRVNRVKEELKVLEGNNFSSYMLVVSDFIRWAKDNDILVGPGRGSVAGSLVAYLLGIHTVDPIEYDLLFERFQNAYKKDLPDIDTDFTSAGRDKVQEYVRHKYGCDHCAQVSNINTYTPKNVIPDLVKSMRNVMPHLVPPGTHYVQVSDAIKAAIPDGEKDMTKALEASPKLRAFAEQAPELMEYAKVIVGMPKEYSTHAAGMVISDEPIVNFAPLRVDKNGAIAVQYEKNRCEKMGLVKMDFLAISTLDVIDETLRNIRILGIEDGPKKMEDIPLDDEATYKMIQNGQTRCVFQLGKSGTMAGLCKQIKPNNILDIAVINALGRPSCGPRKLEDGTTYSERQEYIKRRHGLKRVEYLHPSLETALKETYGLCIMEEQLMSVARDVAGWDLNKADGLRKLTKLKEKGKDLALKLEVDFVADTMKKHDLKYESAKAIWDGVVEKFSGYGFNKSHAVSYSINGYITAYLKCHYPAAFLAAYLKIKTQGSGISRDDEIAVAKTECRRLDIRILPPDINKSGTGYEILDDKTIVMGLAAIKGLGEKAVNEIVDNQPFESFVDFLHKTQGRVVNKSKLEALAKAGCFNSLEVFRKQIHDEGKSIRDKLNAFLRKKVKDGYDVDLAAAEFPLRFQNDEEWGQEQMLRYEQEVLGELVSGTINELFPGFFIGYGTTPLSRIKRLPDRHHITVEVLVKSLLREFKIKKEGRNKGRSMIKYQVEDQFGAQTEMTVWPSQYSEAKKRLREGEPLRAKCQVSEWNGTKSIMLMDIEKTLR